MAVVAFLRTTVYILFVSCHTGGQPGEGLNILYINAIESALHTYNVAKGHTINTKYFLHKLGSLE